ncbi:transposase DNA-binding-containing protein [Sphingobium aquiterrae]
MGQDWANTKAAYRFFSNASVSEEHILAGHFHATACRAGGAEGTLLML